MGANNKPENDTATAQKDKPVVRDAPDNDASTQRNLSTSTLDFSSKDGLKRMLEQAGSGFTRDRAGAGSNTLEITNINSLTDGNRVQGSGGGGNAVKRGVDAVGDVVGDAAKTLYKGDGGLSSVAEGNASIRKNRRSSNDTVTKDSDGNTTHSWSGKDGSKIENNVDGTASIKLLTGDEWHSGPNKEDNYILSAAGKIYDTAMKGMGVMGEIGGAISAGADALAKNAGQIAKDEAAAGYARVDAKKVEDSVDAIHKAVDGIGTDEAAIYRNLEGKSEAEIRAMKARYQEKYGVSLEKDLKSDLTVPIFGDVQGEWKKAEALLNKRDTVDVNQERTKLDTTAKERMSPQEYQQLQQRMQELEARKAKDGLSDEEIARTYREVNRLLEARGDKPLNDDQRKQLSMQIMENAADPTRISQGGNNTCNVTTVETATYTKSPSEAARMITDVALTGKYVTRNGDVVSTDPTPRTDASRNYPPRTDGVRVHASEIFQITAVNTFYQEHGVQRRYDQVNVPPPQNKTDNGERLFDTSKNPPEEIKNGDGKPVRAPGLTTPELVDLARTITGTDKIGALQAPSYSPEDSRVPHARNEQDLNDKLAEAKKNGRLPMIILVNTEVEPLWKDSGGGAAGGSGGAHVITVTDYEPGPPAKVNVDNQWNAAADYQGAKKMDVHDLWKTMQSSPEATKEVQREVNQARAEGRVDVFKETDLLRMQKKTGQISDADYEKATNDLIRRTQEYYAKRAEAVTPEEKAANRERLEQLVGSFPPDKSLAMLDAMKAGGIIDEGRHTFQVELVGWRLTREKERLTNEGKMNGGDEQKKYDAGVKQYEEYLAKLTEAQRVQILTQVRTWG